MKSAATGIRPCSLRGLGFGLLFGLVFAAGAIGCAREPDNDCQELAGAKPVDPVLLAFLGRARAAHHAADTHQQRKDLPKAIESLESVLRGPIPSHEAAEVKEVLADTRARLGDLESQVGDYDAAQAQIQQGLGLLDGPSYFRGHLFEVRGLIEERQAKVLREAGKPDAARAAEQRALKAFEQAMDIQAKVIEKGVGADREQP